MKGEWLNEQLEKIRSVIFPAYQMDERERLMYELVQELMKHKDTEIIRHPIYARYFITNSRISSVVVADEKFTTISSPSFVDSKSSVKDFHEAVLRSIEQRIVQDIEDVELLIFKSEVDLLKIIKKSIK